VVRKWWAVTQNPFIVPQPRPQYRRRRWRGEIPEMVKLFLPEPEAKPWRPKAD
jgi:hypothetical protein